MIMYPSGLMVENARRIVNRIYYTYMFHDFQATFRKNMVA